MALIDVYGGILALGCAAVASGLEIVSHDYIDAYGPAMKVAQHWYPKAWCQHDICDVIEHLEEWCKCT